ncbi:TPA: family 1 glycosylhydrolase [Klebsiella quasipneumoniae subsp. quasipneumoniae]|nr:family 1 glycosylhydrolase [Klebsiella quasipneumoniae subsp. quasipneumoniae]
MKFLYEITLILSSLLISNFALADVSVGSNTKLESERLGHIGKCVDLSSFIRVSRSTDTVVIHSYNHEGNVNSTPFATIKISEAGCFKFTELGYYEIFFPEGNKKTNIAIINDNIAPNFQMGMVTHFGNLNISNDVPRTVKLLNAAGVGWVRDELSWQNVEKNKGIFNFPEQYDNYINTLKTSGLKTTIVLDYGNSNYGGTTNISSSIEPFANYAEQLVKKYGDYVTHWEVWNEPKPKQFGSKGWETYAKLLAQVYSKIKSLQQNSVVIGCGGGGAGGGPGGDCIKAVTKYYDNNIADAFSIHPYLTHSPEKGYSAFNSPFRGLGGYINIESVTKMLKPVAEKKNKPIYITEIGWPSSSDNKVFTDSLQAAFALRTYLLVRRDNFFPVVFWYDFRDDGNDKNNKEHNFGLLENDYTPKMSYVAISNMNSLLNGYKWTKDIVYNQGVIVSEFHNGDKIIQVGWSHDNQIHQLLADARAGYVIDWQGKRVNSSNGNWVLSGMPSYRVLH